jgi:16S rRNA (guanine(966)-N(2))-methyltransferase RsmD
MRVIAGSLKGRRLKAPSWEGLRPTSARLRETLFNVLAPRIAGARVLDAYAGTGAVGIEAISRGAREVVFVEQDVRARRLVGENLSACGVTTGYVILGMDVRRASLASWGAAVGVVDVAFLDPPYATSGPDLEGVLQGVGEVLAPGGVMVLEHARRRPAPDLVGPLVRTRTIRSGDSELSVYGRRTL